MKCTLRQGCPDPGMGGFCPVDQKTWLEFSPQGLALDTLALHHLTECWPTFGSFLSPEYNQSFTLSINRSHRGFRRVVASRGLKLELLHKG